MAIGPPNFMSLNEEAFEALHENLVSVRPELKSEQIVLCPFCLREISRDSVLKGGVEHILPQGVVKADSPTLKRLGTLNQRCGITVLCRQERSLKSNGKIYLEGCNGIKGSIYDRLFKDLFDGRKHKTEELKHRHGVAILMMAYLGAFQNFGYEYILRSDLDEVREQFDYPDARKTNLLEQAQFNLLGGNQIVSTTAGNPFIFGGISTTSAPLHVLFRRCQAYLPGGYWEIKQGVRYLTTLLY